MTLAAVEPYSRSGVSVWNAGLTAALTWAAASLSTLLWPDVVPWGDAEAWGGITAAGAVLLLAAAFYVPRSESWLSQKLRHLGPWLIALGVWFTLWEITTAKTGWLPKPFFSPPQGLLHVYVGDGLRVLVCIGYTLRLWAISFTLGVTVGYLAGLALGWSAVVRYWGMPILKSIGPVPATAWIPVTFYFFPTTFAASIFIIALSCGIPVAILTSSGVQAVLRDYYDVARNLGAKPSFLIRRIAVPASLPHVFVGLFMGLYYSFAVLVVAEMLGAKFGLGWYIQFNTAYSAYANVYAALVIMAVICASLVALLFKLRDRLLAWQEGFIR